MTCSGGRLKAFSIDPYSKNNQAVLELMDWTIFITTMPETAASFRDLLAIYGLRWRVEVISKAWKSHLGFQVVHRVSERQLRLLLGVRLLVIAACANLLHHFYARQLREWCGRTLSLLKFVKYLSASPANLLRVLGWRARPPTEQQNILKSLAKYCCYDKRKHKNFQEIWESLA